MKEARPCQERAAEPGEAQCPFDSASLSVPQEQLCQPQSRTQLHLQAKAGEATLLKEEQPGKCGALPAPSAPGDSLRHCRAPPEGVSGFGFSSQVQGNQSFLIKRERTSSCKCRQGCCQRVLPTELSLHGDVSTPSYACGHLFWGYTAPAWADCKEHKALGTGGRSRQLGWILILIASLFFPACLPAVRS